MNRRSDPYRRRRPKKRTKLLPACRAFRRARAFRRHRITLGLARLELALVQRRALAELFCSAAGLVVQYAEGAFVATPWPVPVASLKAWRREAKRVLEVALEADDLPEAYALIERLLARPLRRWDTAEDLVNAARGLGAYRSARACQAYVELALSNPELGLHLYRELTHDCTGSEEDGLALRGVAAAHVALGSYRLALGAIEGIADASTASVTDLVSGLVLAWRVGDQRRAARAAARLDLQVDAASPELEASLIWLRNWVRADSGLVANARTLQIRLGDPPTPTVRVGRVLMEEGRVA